MMATQATTDWCKIIQDGIRNSNALFEASDKQSSARRKLKDKVSCPAPEDSAYIRFTSHATGAFRFLRLLSNISTEDFMRSICSTPLRSLVDTGGSSGALFYASADGEYLLKTVQKNEAVLLKGILLDYLKHLRDHPDSLLPRIYGFYSCKTSEGKSRLIVMQNIIPPGQDPQRFDLKGSLYYSRSTPKRFTENATHMTLKDLDFLEIYPDGLSLHLDAYEHLMSVLKADCKALKHWHVMDYSLLIGIALSDDVGELRPSHAQRTLEATDESGKRLVIFIGIIDVLQSYTAVKLLEHTFKGLVFGMKKVSVTDPKTYSKRFQKFMREKVFKQAPGTIRERIDIHH